MEATTMRNMMLAATLMTFAACGSVQDASNSGSGSAGSDEGSNAGDTDAGTPEPTTCSSAADCGAGRACDVGSHQCVTGALTIDATDFVVDGATWWTNTSGPTLHGTFQGPMDARVQARVGSNGVLATLDGSSWSVTLPAGSIATSNTVVSIWMTDPSGGLVQLDQIIGVDNAPPAITLKPSVVHDEAGDAVDFSSGQPVHAHSGTQLDLAAPGCPIVHKYTYLMGSTAPMYGRQTTQNPLAWQFTIQDVRLEPSSLSYRVLDAANAIVVNWTPLPAPSSGVYTLELDRTAVAQLATVRGIYHLEVRARDWGNHETTASWCWDHEILAAPMDISAVTPTGNGLFGMTLPADSPISTLISYGTGPMVIEQTITQYTAEPIRLTSAPITGTVHYTKRVVAGWVPVGSGTINADFDGGVPAAPSITTSGGDLTSYFMMMHLIDQVTGQEVWSDLNNVFTIPGRGAAEPPHRYKVMFDMGQVADLWPASDIWYSEYNVGAFTYTGSAPGATQYACTGPLSCYGPTCKCTATIYRQIVALDNAHLDFDPLTVHLKTSPDAVVTPVTPTNVSASSFTTGAMTWDAGDDNLGPY